MKSAKSNQPFFPKKKAKKMAMLSKTENTDAKSGGSFNHPSIQKMAEAHGRGGVIVPKTIPIAVITTLHDPKLTSPKHEDPDARMAAAVEPVVHVPQDLHRHVPHRDRLVPPESPMQIRHPDRLHPVHADPHLRIERPPQGRLDHDAVLLHVLPQRRLRAEAFLREHDLLLVHQPRLVQRRTGSAPRPLQGLALLVAQEEKDLLLGDHDHVVAGAGLRATGEGGGPQVPEDVDAFVGDSEGLEALLAPELPGLEVDLAGVVVALCRVLDGDVEGVADLGFGPRHGYGAECVGQFDSVNACHEIVGGVGF